MKCICLLNQTLPITVTGTTHVKKCRRNLSSCKCLSTHIIKAFQECFFLLFLSCQSVLHVFQIRFCLNINLPKKTKLKTTQNTGKYYMITHKKNSKCWQLGNFTSVSLFLQSINQGTTKKTQQKDKLKSVMLKNIATFACFKWCCKHFQIRLS